MTAALTVVARAVARVPATCGELVQGVDDEGPLLVSLPIAVDGTVQVTLVREPEVLHVQPSRPRALTALRLALDRSGWRGGAVAALGGELPQARGMGSSTVDVAGVIGATLAVCGVAVGPLELARMVAAVEPSDSSALPGLWAVDHVSGARAVPLGRLPSPLQVVALDSGAGVDTLDVHRRDGPGAPMPRDTLAQLAGAVRRGDMRTLGHLAAESAERNQSRLPSPAYDAVRRAAGIAGAAGVCVAHSGSLAAVLCRGPREVALASAALRDEGWSPLTWTAAAPGMRVEICG